MGVLSASSPFAAVSISASETSNARERVKRVFFSLPTIESLRSAFEQSRSLFRSALHEDLMGSLLQVFNEPMAQFDQRPKDLQSTLLDVVAMMI